MKLIDKSEREKGIFAVVLLSFTYGLIALVPRLLSNSFDLFQQIYLRIFFGVIILLIIFRKKVNLNKIIKLPAREHGWIFFRSFLYYFMGVGLYNFAILNTKISNVVFIGAIPMTAILGFVLLRERITFSKIVLVLLSALGVIIISVKDFSGNLTFGIGELAALFSALFISLGLVTRNKKLVSLNDQEIAILMLSFATVQFVIASFIFGEGLPLDGWNYWILLIVLFGGLLNASLSYLMNYGFHRVDAVMASNIISADVVAATFFAFLVFKEIPNMNELLGGILIIVSAILLHKYDGKLKNS